MKGIGTGVTVEMGYVRMVATTAPVAPATASTTESDIDFDNHLLKSFESTLCSTLSLQSNHVLLCTSMS